jgi:hypothetical protein
LLALFLWHKGAKSMNSWSGKNGPAERRGR